MNIFDLKPMKAHPYEERDKNVFFQADTFKARIIELPPNSELPACDMASHIIFYIIKGAVQVTVNNEKKMIKEGNCLISGPASIQVKSESGVKIMGIQVDVKHD